MIVYVKEPNKHPEKVEANVDLAWLQGKVDGYIETYPLGPDAVIVCNEEGKLKSLARNFTLARLSGPIMTVLEDFVGTVVFVGLKPSNDGMVFADFDRKIPEFLDTLIVKE